MPWGTSDQKIAFGKLFPQFYGSVNDRNEADALKALIPLAEAGYPPAMHTVGYARELGRGTRKNLILSFEWYLKAAHAGYPSSECAVGNFFNMVFPPHTACPHDPATAAAWYLRAAQHGNNSAQYNLAVMYRTGNGVEKDPARSYLWASLAIHCSPIRDRPSETERSQALSLLTAEMIYEIDQQIAEIQPTIPLPWSGHLQYWRLLFNAATQESG